MSVWPYKMKIQTADDFDSQCSSASGPSFGGGARDNIHQSNTTCFGNDCRINFVASTKIGSLNTKTSFMVMEGGGGGCIHTALFDCSKSTKSAPVPTKDLEFVTDLFFWAGP
jgi:hypothetical protein